MGLFHSNYNKPGPGVRKDEPRKKGLARFGEIMGRDMGDLFRANVLCTVGYIPLLALVFLGILGRSVLIVAAGGILGGLLLGPCYAGLHDTILRALRDEPGYWWNTYKKAMRQNWKASLVPGMLLGFLLATQLFMLFFMLTSGAQASLPSLVLLFANVLTTAMAAPFVFAQLVLMDLPLGSLLKNSLLLALSHAPKVILMAAVQVVYWGVIIAFLPYTTLWLPLFGFALVTVICMMIVFPILDKTFDLERKINDKREQEFSGQ